MCLFLSLSVPTRGGNAGGADCVFPFYYDGAYRQYCVTGGTVQPSLTPWCATTDNYYVDGEWGECISM